MEEKGYRKRIRLPNYDYSSCGVYFLTICTRNRDHIFWRTGAQMDPAEVYLSEVGELVCSEIRKISSVYPAVSIDKYCIMPDHIHLLLRICAMQSTVPSVSRIVQQFKGSITKQLGKSIWQKSYMDHVIRNEADYLVRWNYIENNPVKYRNGV